jgi:hypothetical protein
LAAEIIDAPSFSGMRGRQLLSTEPLMRVDPAKLPLGLYAAEMASSIRKSPLKQRLFRRARFSCWFTVEKLVGRTEERSDDVPAFVIYGEFWIAGAALCLVRPA